MNSLTLKAELFPSSERLQYGLKMLGAKGQLTLTCQTNGTSINLRCQILASLIVPPKKLVDSDLRSEIESKGDEVRVIRHIDNDYKSEARRTLELKNQLIETRYIKFDEERGFLDYPEGLQSSKFFDPLTAVYLLRDKSLLKEGREAKAHVIVRSGFLEVGFLFGEERIAEVEAFNEPRRQIRLTLNKLAGGEVKGPYLSKDLEVWIDQETGCVAEVSYSFLGAFGRASLLLEKVDRDF